MKLLGKLSFLAILLSFAAQAFSDNHLVFQLGDYSSAEGKSQDVHILDLIGDRYTVESSAASTLNISTAIPSHTYPSAGIKINSSGTPA